MLAEAAADGAYRVELASQNAGLRRERDRLADQLEARSLLSRYRRSAAWIRAWRSLPAAWP
jgi:hypothetical protein